MKPDIDSLLEKYWEGESSIEDEQILKQYFLSSHILDKHDAYRDLFVYFHEESQIQYPFKNQQIESNQETIVKVRSLSIKKYIFAAAAIMVLALCSIFVVKNLKSDNQTKESYSQVQEIEDPEEALRVTKQALALLSKNFNSSTKVVKENMGSLEKASIFK